MDLERRKIIEILSWIKDKKLWPSSFSGGELFVEPILNRFVKWKDLREDQRRYALWVPDIKILTKVLNVYGLELSQFTQDGIYFVELATKKSKIAGVGIGSREAILSMMNIWRLRILAVSAC